MVMLQTGANVRWKRRKKIFRKEDAALYLMALPTVIFLLIFCYLPMGGLVMAFQDLNITKGIFSSPFVGLKNFEFLFSTTDACVTIWCLLWLIWSYRSRWR